MKAIILAAGKGVRMGRYTETLPKGMLPFRGKPLLEHQINILRESGIDEINIVTGYHKEAITFDHIKYYHNPDFAVTNMLESLMCAREAFDADLLISYADLIYTRDLVTQLIQENGPIAVAVDSAWRQYWTRRFGSAEDDLETLTIENHQIIELGKEVTSSRGIDYRYIGIMKFSKDVWPVVYDLYQHKQEKNEAWKQSGKDFRNGYMTDLLNELIQEGVPIVPSITEKQWLEFDTAVDYEMNINNLKNGTLSEYFEGKL